MIDKNTAIEDLVREYPQSVQYLMEKGIKCIACGEPVWGTLESNAKENGFEDSEIKNIIDELRVKVSG